MEMATSQEMVWVRRLTAMFRTPPTAAEEELLRCIANRAVARQSGDVQTAARLTTEINAHLTTVLIAFQSRRDAQ